VRCDIQLRARRASSELEGRRHRGVPRAAGVAHQHRAPFRREERLDRAAVDDGELHLEVEDDGRGIAPQDLAKARSLGLKGMRERFAYLGGSLEIARAPRGGTRLRAPRAAARRCAEAAA
jgi:signal transduction histidine kinase